MSARELLRAQQAAQLTELFTVFCAPQPGGGTRGLGAKQLSSVFAALGADASEAATTRAVARFGGDKGWLDEEDFLQLMTADLFAGEPAPSAAGAGRGSGAQGGGLLSSEAAAAAKEELLAAFAWADRDGDGVVSGADLLELLEEFNSEEGASAHSHAHALRVLLLGGTHGAGATLAGSAAPITRADVRRFLDAAGDVPLPKAGAGKGISLAAFTALCSTPAHS